MEGDSEVTFPWWAKIGAKIALSRLPVGYSLWRRLGWFRHGRMDSSAYAIDTFRHHLVKSGYVGQLGERTVLELGPGDSVATAVIAAAYGARSILVDSGRYSRSDIKPYRSLERALVEEGLSPPELGHCGSVDEILERCEAIYLSNGLVGLREIKAESVDLIFSQAVLEHVRRHEFLDTMKECRRVLKRSGLCSHTIDLRDHLGGGLNNLRFSRRIWESEFFASSGFYTNRLSFRRMQELFNEAGFEVILDGVRRWERLPTSRRHLAREFQDVPDEELCVSGFEVVLR